MPRGDGTGPMSQGPMTGRNAGFCAGFPAPGYRHPAPRSARSFGRKGGQGYRYMYYATGLPGWMRFGYKDADPEYGREQKKKLLEQQANHLETMLNDIKKRIKALEDEDTVEDDQ